MTLPTPTYLNHPPQYCPPTPVMPPASVLPATVPQSNANPKRVETTQTGVFGAGPLGTFPLNATPVPATKPVMPPCEKPMKETSTRCPLMGWSVNSDCGLTGSMIFEMRAQNAQLSTQT